MLVQNGTVYEYMYGILIGIPIQYQFYGSTSIYL